MWNGIWLRKYVFNNNQGYFSEEIKVSIWNIFFLQFAVTDN